MQSQVSEIDPVTVEVQVEVPWDRIQKGLDDTFTKLQRSARVKGFRPGKAPRSVLQKLFSKDVQAEVVSNLVEETVVEAVRQHELPVVSTAKLDQRPELTTGQPLTFTVKFEVRPKIESLETSLTLTRTIERIGSAEVDAEIERLRQQHALMRPLEGERTAQKGDVVTIDYEVTIDGVAKPDMKGEGRPVNLGEGRLLEEIDAGLLGTRPGDERTIEIARGENDENKELAGKKVVFAVRVKEVRERVLPDLDDEFAKDVGEYETLADLRTKLQERLEEGAKSKSENQLRSQAVEELANKNPIPVPPSLIDQQLRSMLSEYFKIMQMIGQAPNLDPNEINDMRGRAESKVRSAILLGELSRREKIEVTPDEVEAKMQEIAERSGKHIAKVRADHAGEKREALETQILENKLIRYLLDHATITDVTASPTAASGKE
jgi:trigger factor